MLHRISRHPRAQAAASGALSTTVRLIARSTRWGLLGEANLHAVLPPNGPPGFIAAFWHERLPMMPMLWTEARRRAPALAAMGGHVLVSRHRDGRLIGDVMTRFGATPIHASTSRGGAAGLREMLRALAAGGVVIVTPDGPRGPPRRAAPGVAQLAALSGRPILPCAAATSRARVLGSWDRMVVPLPFGRGTFVLGPPIRVARGDATGALPGIEAALTAACDAADATVGRG